MIIKRYCSVALAFCLSLWFGAQIECPRTNASNVNQAYRDDRIQAAIAANWSSSPVYRSSDGVRSSKDLIGVVLSDGPFDLYLLTHYGEASGVRGGLAEVAAYVVPWLKSEEPASCFDVFKRNLNRVSTELVRVDLILDPKPDARSKDPSCLAIQRQVSRRAWAGAYFGSSRENNRAPGFFINIPLGTDRKWPSAMR